MALGGYRQSGYDHELVIEELDASLQHKNGVMDVSLSDKPITDACPPFNLVHFNRRVISTWKGIDKLGDLAHEAHAKSAAVLMNAFFESTEVAAHACKRLQDASGTASADSWCLIVSCHAAIAFNGAHLGLRHVPHGLANALAHVAMQKLTGR